MIIASITIISVLICWNYLNDDHNSASTSPAFVIPDKSLMVLGLIAFCSMVCEGAMFDWSVIYFKKIVLAEKAWIAAGYTAFMCTRSEEHTSELQSLMRISYAVFCLKKKNKKKN